MYKIHIVVLALASSLGMQVKGATIPVTYNFFAEGLTGPPVMMGTTLIVDAFFTGSVLSGDPSLNAVWNPVTYSDHSVIDLTTGLLNGTFTMTFANGNMLLGNLFEDVSQVIPTGGTGGAFTQRFTFTGGTGEFAGATGSLSGAGVAGIGGSASGSGTINTSAIPEPASSALFLSGMAVILVVLRQSKLKNPSEQM
jgi:hypothetical protein